MYVCMCVRLNWIKFKVAPLNLLIIHMNKTSYNFVFINTTLIFVSTACRFLFISGKNPYLKSSKTKNSIPHQIQKTQTNKIRKNFSKKH